MAETVEQVERAAQAQEVPELAALLLAKGVALALALELGASQAVLSRPAQVQMRALSRPALALLLDLLLAQAAALALELAPALAPALALAPEQVGRSLCRMPLKVLWLSWLS